MTIAWLARVAVQPRRSDNSAMPVWASSAHSSSRVIDAGHCSATARTKRSPRSPNRSGATQGPWIQAIAVSSSHSIAQAPTMLSSSTTTRSVAQPRLREAVQFGLETFGFVAEVGGGRRRIGLGSDDVREGHGAIQEGTGACHD